MTRLPHEDHGQVFICDRVEIHSDPFWNAVLCLKCFLTFCFAGKPEKVEVKCINPAVHLLTAYINSSVQKFKKVKRFLSILKKETGCHLGETKVCPMFAERGWHTVPQGRHTLPGVAVTRGGPSRNGHREQFSLQRVIGVPPYVPGPRGDPHGTMIGIPGALRSPSQQNEAGACQPVQLVKS